MSTANDIYSQQVLYSDGEGLEFGDLNDSQTLHNRMLFDNLLMSMIPNVAADNPGSISASSGFWASSKEFANTLLNSYGKDLVFTHDPGQCYWRPKATANNTLQLVPGTILLPNDDPSAPASDFAMVPFRLGGYSLATELTVAVGDATNPRLDLVQIKVEWESGAPVSRDFEDSSTRVSSTTTPNTRRRVKCTFQVKTGTPAAIPSYPAPDAGFRAMAAVLVPATFNSVIGTSVQLRDLRWPLGRIGVYEVPAQRMLQSSGVTQWVQYNYGMNAPAGAGNILLPCPVVDPTARLIGIGLVGNDSANPGSGAYLLSASPDGNGSASTVGTLAAPHEGLLQTSGAGYLQLNALSLMDQMSGVAGHVGHGSGLYVGDRAAGTYVGTPIWLNGYASGVARTPSAAEIFGLVLQVSPQTDCKLGKVRFIVAHGLG